MNSAADEVISETHATENEMERGVRGEQEKQAAVIRNKRRQECYSTESTQEETAKDQSKKDKGKQFMSLDYPKATFNQMTATKRNL
ncbi:hypothetical protein EUGRSUZ_K02014 [Eucalyptus grandis]|uniref:Uncharacterized protein n=2 Tax=Eucalyptus grandis TaxID=71139 RepID=A0ACC3IX31_EUCGR|nr:hypothetical protein EUGRSUZ_K02014 [Eucalyptus grandis]